MLVAWSDHVARETSLSWPNLYSDWAIRRRRRFVRFLGNFALTRGGDGCLCEVKGVGAPPNPYNVFLMHARARLIGSSQRLGYSTRLMRYNLKTFSSRLGATVTVTFLVGATPLHIRLQPFPIPMSIGSRFRFLKAPIVLFKRAILKT